MNSIDLIGEFSPRISIRDRYGSKVLVCVITDDSLTYGKLYSGVNSGLNYFVNNDIDESIFYPRTWFITIEEWRELQINKVLDEI